MNKHAHYWDAMDIPGWCICICGATRHYVPENSSYCVHDDDSE